MKKISLVSYVKDNDIAKTNNKNLLVGAPLLFVMAIFIVSDVFHRKMELYILIAIISFFILWIVGIKALQLGKYFNLSEAMLNEEPPESLDRKQEIAPVWEQYKLRAYKEKAGIVGFLALVFSILFRRYFGVSDLPVYGLSASLLLTVFSLLISYKKYILKHYEMYSGDLNSKLQTGNVLLNSLLIKYWIIFITAFAFLTGVQYFSYQYFLIDYGYLHIIKYSLYIATVTAITMGVVYAFRVYDLMLMDLDEIRMKK